MALEKLTQGEFEQRVEQTDGRVVVDFYADWCGPCRQVTPELEQLASKWADDVRFVKLDIDESPDIARRYEVSSIPTIILFVDGQVAARTMGARPAQVIENDLGLAAGRAA